MYCTLYRAYGYQTIILFNSNSILYFYLFIFKLLNEKEFELWVKWLRRNAFSFFRLFFLFSELSEYLLIDLRSCKSWGGIFSAAIAPHHHILMIGLERNDKEQGQIWFTFSRNWFKPIDEVISAIKILNCLFFEKFLFIITFIAL